MTILTSEQIETELKACELRASENWFHRTMTELRAAFTIGRDQGTAETIQRAVDLLGSPIADAQAEQLTRAVSVLVAWCDAGDHLLECRSYSARRTSFTDPEKRWCATAHCLSASHPVHGASHAEALSKLATWCANHASSQALDHDGKTEPNNERPEL